MPARIIIPATSPLHVPLMDWTHNTRMLFLVGLPGVGKTLLLQQCALMAHAHGRAVHLLQWDVARAAYETPSILAKYAEENGVTHPALRKAAGLWARTAVADWATRHASRQHLLLGELPLVGNRLVELIQLRDDAAEPALREAQFVLPVPGPAVRVMIEAARERSIAQPAHSNECADAPPNVLRDIWHDVHTLAARLGFVAKDANTGLPPYDPEIYAQTFLYLLRHRHAQRLDVNEVFPRTGSPYELEHIYAKLVPSSAEVNASLQQVEALSAAALNAQVNAWWN